MWGLNIINNTGLNELSTFDKKDILNVLSNMQMSYYKTTVI